jgi:hypothetical protein
MEPSRSLKDREKGTRRRSAAAADTEGADAAQHQPASAATLPLHDPGDADSSCILTPA